MRKLKRVHCRRGGGARVVGRAVGRRVVVVGLVVLHL